MAEQILGYLDPPPYNYGANATGQDFRCGSDGSLVVYVDGACPGNHTYGRRVGGVGAYFGLSSGFNYSAQVPENFNNCQMTSNRAEATAVLAAMYIMLKNTRAGRIRLYTDSTYIHTAMINLDSWARRGYRGCLANGGDALNADLLQAVYELKGKFDYVDCKHVSREDSDMVQADRLAKAGAAM